jgi:hypothetical protein
MIYTSILSNDLANGQVYSVVVVVLTHAGRRTTIMKLLMIKYGICIHGSRRRCVPLFIFVTEKRTSHQTFTLAQLTHTQTSLHFRVGIAFPVYTQSEHFRKRTSVAAIPSKNDDI